MVGAYASLMPIASEGCYLRYKKIRMLKNQIPISVKSLRIPFLVQQKIDAHKPLFSRDSTYLQTTIPCVNNDYVIDVVLQNPSQVFAQVG